MGRAIEVLIKCSEVMNRVPQKGSLISLLYTRNFYGNQISHCMTGTNLKTLCYKMYFRLTLIYTFLLKNN